MTNFLHLIGKENEQKKKKKDFFSDSRKVENEMKIFFPI